MGSALRMCLFSAVWMCLAVGAKAGDENLKDYLAAKSSGWTGATREALGRHLGAYTFERLDPQRRPAADCMIRVVDSFLKGGQDAERAAGMGAVIYIAARDGGPCEALEALAARALRASIPVDDFSALAKGLAEMARQGVGGPGELLARQALEKRWSVRDFNVMKRALMRAKRKGYDADDFAVYLLGHRAAGDKTADKIIAMALREFQQAKQQKRPPRLPAYSIARTERGEQPQREPQKPSKTDLPDRPSKEDKLHKERPGDKLELDRDKGAESSQEQGSFELRVAKGIQPGLVWLTGVMSTNTNVHFEIEVHCANPYKVGSVKAYASQYAPGKLRVALQTDLEWLETNRYISPCHIQQIDISMHGRELLADAEIVVDIPMDVPFSHLHPVQVTFPTTNVPVNANPPQIERRHLAYPPRIIAIRDGHGRVGFAEVEELPARGPDKEPSLGLRYLIVYRDNENDSFELGGGAELYDGWGLDISGIGVGRRPVAVEEYHPGHDIFADHDKLLPSHPLYSWEVYIDQVLDNKRVHRCWGGDDCLDMIYLARSHEIKGVGPSRVVSLDPGPIEFRGVVATEHEAAIYYPVEDGKLVRQDSVDRRIPKKLGSEALIPLKKEDKQRILSARFPVPHRVFVSSKPFKQTWPPSPQEKRIGQSRARSGIIKATSSQVAIVESTRVDFSSIDMGSLSKCAGISISPFRCPTNDHPIDVKGLPREEPATYELTVLNNLPPYYRSRSNATGTCGTHAFIQFYETLIRQVANKLVPRRIYEIDGTPFCVPDPPVSFSVAAALSFLHSDYGQRVAGDWPDEGHLRHWTILDSYWPVRSGNFMGWADRQNMAEEDGKDALLYCSGLTCSLDSECPGVCVDGRCQVGGASCGEHEDCHGTCTNGTCFAKTCSADSDCTAPEVCLEKYCTTTCGGDEDCPADRHHCRHGACWPNSRYWKNAFCIAQGQPPIGVYVNYSRKKYNEENYFDPTALGPWSLANWPVKAWLPIDKTVECRFRSWQDARTKTAFQFVIDEIRMGLPVELGFLSEVKYPLIQGPTWLVPPELGGVSREQLSDQFLVSDRGHAVLIVGYSLRGTLSDPDPYNSYFILENNWGKDSGYESFFFMNLAAFTLLANELRAYRLDCDLDVPACQVQPPRVVHPEG
ncbi:MAG: hypothetical protein JXR96_06230 [Deltaproteobacteria bacterium]|nr:hypothetical protein [Deltaproteobacteria bacterium]